MLDLMDFKKEFVSLCRNTLSERGTAGIEVEERKVSKAQRGTLNGLLFRQEGLDCAPTFYIEDFYKAYKEGMPISDLSDELIETAFRSMDMARHLARNSFSMLGDPDSLRVRMLNKGRNKEYLKGIPYRDLGCGFVYIMEVGHGEYGAVITDALMKDYEISKDELFDKAIENTAGFFPAVLQDLAESACGRPEDCSNLLELPAARAPAGAGPGFVLTNSRYFWGAGALFYPGVMERIRELLGGDFYVLPSSVHELIILAVEDQDPQQLAYLVRAANRDVVADSDILSDDLYICRSGKICRVSYGGVIPACADNIC